MEVLLQSTDLCSFHLLLSDLYSQKADIAAHRTFQPISKIFSLLKSCLKPKMPRAAKSGSWIMLNPILFSLHGGGIDACSSFFYRLTNCKSSFTEKAKFSCSPELERIYFLFKLLYSIPIAQTVLPPSILPVPFAIPLGACWAASTQWCGSIVASLFLFFPGHHLQAFHLSSVY